MTKNVAGLLSAIRWFLANGCYEEAEDVLMFVLDLIEGDDSE